MLKTQQQIHFCFLLFFVTIFSPVSWAQSSQLNPVTPIKYYEHRSWKEIDGVEINHVFDIDQDNKDYIWLATNRGLLRFDSSKIEAYNFRNVDSLRTETVRFVEIGRDNSVWFGTRRGLFYIKDKVAYEQRNQDGSAISGMLSLEVDGDGIPHFTLNRERKLYKIIDDQVVEIEAAGEGVFKVFKGRNGKLLALKYPLNGQREIIVINQQGELNFTPVPKEINKGLYSIAEGPFGEFYLGTEGYKLYKLDDGTVELLDEGDNSGRMHTLLVDYAGTIFYSKFEGFERIHRGNRDVFTSAEGLTNNKVDKVFFDNSGNLWVGTLDGLNYFSKGPFTIFPKENSSVKANFNCVYQFDDGAVIVGSNSSGLFSLENDVLVQIDLAPINRTKINCIAASGNNNEVYVSAENGAYLLKKEEGNFKIVKQISDKRSGSIFERSNGDLWLSTKRSTSSNFIDRETISVINENAVRVVEELEGLWVLNYYEDKDGVLWILTSNGLFKSLNNSDLTLEKVPELKSYWMSSSVVDKDEKFWVGTLGTGLHLIDEDTIIKYDTRNGMSVNQAVELLYSEEGGFWLFKGNQDRRLERLIPYQDNGVKKIGVGEYYSFKHRQDIGAINESPSFVTAQDGSMLLPGMNGLIRFNPKDILYSKPRVRFDKIVADTETFTKGDEMIFPSEYDDFEFHFSAVDFTRGERQIFEVKLEGFDEEWKSVDNRQVVYYPRLPAGNYTFKVRLNNPEYGRIALEVPVEFKKVAIWYKRTNVIVFFVVLMLILIYAVFRFRINQVKNQRTLLKLKVDERTSELNELNQNLEATVEKRTREIYKINEELIQKEERYKYALEASTDGIWDWDVSEDEIQFSPAIYTMLGYEPYEFPETRSAIYKHIHPEDVRKEHMNYHNRLMLEAGDEMLLDEYRMIGKKGNIVWVQVKGKVVERDAKGKPSRMVGTHVNITKEKEKTKEILDAVLNTEFVERSRISKDIHDGLQQTLTISSLNFQWVRKDIANLTEKAKEKFEQGWHYLQASITESRQVAHSLMPKEVLDLGVIAAFDRRIEEFDKVMDGTRLNFYHNFKSDKIENQQVEIILYRILQEALNNIAKYSKAKTVTVQLKDYQDIYMLTIEDDGVGFEMEKLNEKGRGLGFKSMQNRLDAINGFLEIDSMPGRGTTILVEINK